MYSKIKQLYKSKIFKTILSVLLSLIILYYLLKSTQLNLNTFLNSIKNIPVLVILLFASFGLFSNLLRVYRFYILHYESIAFIKLFWIINQYQFYSNILPYRTGELSYIYLLRKFNYSNIAESGGALIYTRIIDLLALSVIILLSTFFITTSLVNGSFNIIYLQIGLLIFIILSGLTLIYPGKLIKIFIYFAEKFKTKFTKLLARKLFEVIKYTQKINIRSNLFKLFIISVFIYIFIFFNYYFLFIPFGITLNLFEIVIASSFTLITLFLPIQGIANVGTYEGTFLLGLLFFNIDKNVGMNYILTTHAFSILLIFIFFIISKLAEYCYFKKIQIKSK